MDLFNIVGFLHKAFLRVTMLSATQYRGQLYFSRAIVVFRAIVPRTVQRVQIIFTSKYFCSSMGTINDGKSDGTIARLARVPPYFCPRGVQKNFRVADTAILSVVLGNIRIQLVNVAYSLELAGIVASLSIKINRTFAGNNRRLSALYILASLNGGSLYPKWARCG
jgi:hypothetical protein